MLEDNKDIKDYFIREEILNPKISVIVPMYNSEKYIEKCLNSLIKQTLKDIEIILVDDGSNDKTVEICKKYSSLDKRIKILNQEHKKQGSARNKGTNIAKGEYIGYIDSDDWIDEDYYEKLYSTAKKYNADMSMADYIRIGNGKTKKRINIKKEEFVVNFKDKLKVSKQAKNPCPTIKIYKASMLKNNNITWPEDIFCEDKLFTLQALYYANSLVTCPNTYYYYFRNPTSTVNSKSKEHVEKAKKDKEFAKSSQVDFLREKKELSGDKIFWKTTKKTKFYKIKESVITKRIYLFGIIPVFQTKI